MPVAEPMTAEAYLARPYDPVERGWELIGGELVDMNDPRLRHELACAEISYALEVWRRARSGRGLAIRSIDVLIGPRDVYGPDILWYREDRALPRDTERVHPVPDLAVEVRSPSTWRYDIGAKKSGYERAGLPELWLIDTAADVVLVFRRSTPNGPHFDVALELTRHDKLTSPLLPGFALRLSAVFGE
ncbi:MAG TPA: Uma2 family endonuclease [Solirubrobacteraceae bacterium]|nr:Uma2 family endonuclease [Solirubrobacteraceae bacterium]